MNENHVARVHRENNEKCSGWHKTHLASESEETRDDHGQVLFLPQVDGLEDVDVRNSVVLECLLEPER